MVKKLLNLPDKEFFDFNDKILFERIKLISYMLIITYPCFFVVDFFFFRPLKNPFFKSMLSAVHLTGLLISLCFLLIYQLYKSANKRFIINLYIFLYLMIGAVSSLNSQLFTGNIYAYIIILLSVAVIFPIRPRTLCIIFLGIHLFFLIGLSLMGHNYLLFLSKMINSTGAAVISFTIAFSFYRFRQNDFSNKLKLKRNEESFIRLFNMNPTPLILAKQQTGEILLVNKYAIEYYHLDGKDITQMNTDFLFKDPQERFGLFKQLEEQPSIKHYVTEQQISPERSIWSILNFELVDYFDDVCILIGTTDITDMKKKEAELSRHASFDILTGVMNRRNGMELLRKHFSDGFSSQEFIICYIDINNLKLVNDRYGHSTGDDLIKTCCETFNRCINQGDVLFRQGGDEFIIIFFHKEIERVQEIWKNIEREFYKIDRPYPISASHGLYHYKPGTKITIEEILELADQEMYRNKKGGQSPVALK